MNFNLIDILPDRLSRFVAMFGLVSYVIGSSLALASQDAFVFQRFGSLGVAAAILFFTDRLLQIELRRQQSVERLLHEYGLELEVMKEGVSAKNLPGKGFETDYRKEEVQFSKLRKNAERINSYNIFLLTIATLQWGFGDVFLTWVTT